MGTKETRGDEFVLEIGKTSQTFVDGDFADATDSFDFLFGELQLKQMRDKVQDAGNH